MSKISIDLFSKKSISNAIKDIVAEKESLQQKCEDYVNELLELGYNVALEQVNKSPLGNTITIKSDISAEDMGCRAVITAIGKNIDIKDREPFNTLLAVEFGAGIHYNSGEGNPNASEYGYGVGTYPEQTHAFQEEGWYYLGDDGKYHHSYGVKATMPMFLASEKMLDEFKTVAEKYFGEVR